LIDILNTILKKCTHSPLPAILVRGYPLRSLYVLLSLCKRTRMEGVNPDLDQQI